MLLAPVLMLFASSLMFVSGAVQAGHGSEWCYQAQVVCDHSCKGPEQWNSVSKKCSGRKQSPINIVTEKMWLNSALLPFQFIGYNDAFQSDFTNTGHSVVLNVPTGIKIKGSDLSEPYKAVQLQFHWGKNGGPGSEHKINGEQYPMEMHIVHMKEHYTSLGEAIKDYDGLAVLGFFFEVSKEANKNYDPLINALKKIIHPGNSTTVKSSPLKMLIPPEKNLTAYYRYAGSLTTPDCSEAVVWSLFQNTIPLSTAQLTAFSKLLLANGKKMVQTYRPVQLMNGRHVYFSKVKSGVNKTAILLVVAIAAGVGGYFWNKKKNSPDPVEAQTELVEAQTEPKIE